MFNAAKAYCDIKERYLKFVLDRTCGAFPNVDAENTWNAVRGYLTIALTNRRQSGKKTNVERKEKL